MRLKRQSLLSLVARGDGALFDFICARRSGRMNRMMILATKSGDGLTYPIIAATGVVLAGNGGLALVGAAATAGLASLAGYCVKRLIARPRPTHAAAHRVALVAPPDAWSFPSAHTATAIALAVALGLSMGPAICCAALTWALLVGVSRVYVGAHYPLDVVMGAALGAVIAFGCAEPLDAIATVLATAAK
jgi:undecaprenyl-diphosphatase